ncbi:NAD-dependent epimerase/dehydratase family protein [Sphingobacterium cellulitidis]|uniref:NAD-dependent epimerase/dehydratase family protein n=1 Tax=Sphingobacterium cellulitidis TaxID=1768011 RepID=UPI00370D1035
MKIIITGSSGFVGQNLSFYLQSHGYSVEGISLRFSKWVDKFNEPLDGIIHLAGKAHDTSNTSKPEEYFIINRDLTIHLFQRFIKSNAKDFFYFSSVKAAADTVDGILFEDIPANPLTPYGKSKLEAEQYLMSQYLPQGKRLFIIRPCMIHGPGNKGNLNLLYNIVKKGIPWPLGAFENKRSFLSINNLNFLIGEILKNSNVQSGIYNFADNGTISTNNLVQLISNSLSKKSNIWNINKTLIESVAKIGDKLPLPLNTERLKKLTESYIVSNQKIMNELKISKLPMTLEAGLIQTIKSFNS